MILLLVLLILWIWYRIAFYGLCHKHSLSHAWLAFVPILSFLNVLRIARMSLWWIVLFFLPMILILLRGIIGNLASAGIITTFIVLVFFSTILLIVVALRATIKMCRASGQSGWFCILLFFSPLRIWAMYRLQKSVGQASAYDQETIETFRNQSLTHSLKDLKSQYLRTGWTSKHFDNLADAVKNKPPLGEKVSGVKIFFLFLLGAILSAFIKFITFTIDIVVFGLVVAFISFGLLSNFGSLSNFIVSGFDVSELVHMKNHQVQIQYVPNTEEVFRNR